jgi:hypothetical protein
MADGLAWAAALVLVLALVARFGPASSVAQLPGFWRGADAHLHRLAPAGRRGEFEADGPDRCRLRGWRRLVCDEGRRGRLGLDGRRLFWDDGDVWYRQGP